MVGDLDPDPPAGGGAVPRNWTFRADELVAERFVIRRAVGPGGMGEVYEAEDLELRGRVALKTLLAAKGGDDGLEPFRREIHLARRISHPNVCRVHDAFRHRTEHGDILIL